MNIRDNENHHVAVIPWNTLNQSRQLEVLSFDFNLGQVVATWEQVSNLVYVFVILISQKSIILDIAIRQDAFDATWERISFDR